MFRKIGTYLLLVVSMTIGGMGLSACGVDSQSNKTSVSGCVIDRDIYVVIDNDNLLATNAPMCSSTNAATEPDRLPKSVKVKCLFVTDGPGIGAGTALVTWKDEQELVTTKSCEPL